MAREARLAPDSQALPGGHRRGECEMKSAPGLCLLLLAAVLISAIASAALAA
jgi:hypothetical protein